MISCRRCKSMRRLQQVPIAGDRVKTQYSEGDETHIAVRCYVMTSLGPRRR